MPKKADNAARVEANRRAAYHKKARALLGFVRADASAIDAAFGSGTPAEVFALALAVKEPVGAAVWPVKVDAVEAAGNYAKMRIGAMTKRLEENGWDLNKFLPRLGRHEHYLSRKVRDADRADYTRIFEYVDAMKACNSPECLLKRDDAKEVLYVGSCESEAAAEYDAFVLKLVAKIGPGVTSAALDGSHVWAHSILTVRKGAATERWKTQQIWNVSVLGKDFPQWPTRLLKEGAK